MRRNIKSYATMRHWIGLDWKSCQASRKFYDTPAVLDISRIRILLLQIIK